MKSYVPPLFVASLAVAGDIAGVIPSAYSTAILFTVLAVILVQAITSR